jgi:acetyl-CoA acyltransferase 1
MIVDPRTENEVEIVVDAGDSIQDGVTAVSLSKLKPSFSKGGSTHAGNASQVPDGAAAVLLARRSVVKRLGLPIVGRFVNSAVVSVPPRIMGVGPAFANPKVLDPVGLTEDEVDFYEINEAFASQAVLSIRHFKIPFEKVNINGGAIAIRHPLGCMGARQISTGLNVARQTGGRVFVTLMCIGSGMGMAAVFVSER